ncbi:hypothetical protein IAT38_006527 [Cryptococcus sp. DSM 104549]
MSYTVALYNHNGLVGKALLHELIKEYDKGTFKLVVLHRPQSDLSALPKDTGIETKAVYVDAPEGHEEDNKKAVAGLNIVVSAASIPEDVGDDSRLSLLLGRNQLDDMARGLGVPITLVKAGGFPEWGFNDVHGMCLTDVRKNELYVSDGWENAVWPITSPAYLAAAISNLIATSPKFIANKDFYAIESSPTGYDFATIFTTLNGGTAPKINTVTEEQRQEWLDKELMWAVLAACLNKWMTGAWTWPGEEIKPYEGWKGMSLEEQIKAQK